MSRHSREYQYLTSNPKHEPTTAKCSGVFNHRGHHMNGWCPKHEPVEYAAFALSGTGARHVR